MIVANEPYTVLINCTCKNRLGCSLLPLTLIPQYPLEEVQLIKSTLKQTKFGGKTVRTTQLLLVLVGLHNFHLSRPYGACVKRGSGKHVRSQSFSSKSAVKYLHVGRRKIQISPPLGEQDQSNALPQGQQRQSNPHPMPCLPPPAAYH